MVSLGSRLATRFKQASYFSLNDIVLYGKYKNHRGKIVGFGKDKWGNPTIEIEPIPKGRKQNKIMGLFKIWRADVKEKAMAEMATKQATVNQITRRLVARYVQAFGVDIGRTVNVGSIRIHRYREQLQITDLTNAGKRGKKVKILSVTLGYGSAIPSSEHETWFTEISKALVNQTTIEGVQNYLNHVKEEEPYLSVTFREVRGIDVEPTGAKITLKTNTGLVIEAAPNEFRVLNRWPLTNPQTGKSIGFQDTNYYNKGKDSAAAFFTWLQANLSQANTLDMDGLRKVWDRLDVNYDYQ
jgi:hypothetical protein